MKGGRLESKELVFATFFLMAFSGVPLVIDSSTSAAAGPAAAPNNSSTGMALGGVQATSGTLSSSPYQIVLSSFNAGAGSDRLLVVGVEANDYPVAGITFGGSQLTRAVGSFVNNDAEFWYLTGPAGAADIVVTMSGPTSVVVGAYSFSGVNQTDPIPTSATDYATAPGSPTVSMSTQYPASWVLDSNPAVPVASGSPPMTVGEFLNASMRACNCYIIPGVSLNQYDQGTFFTTARALLALPVYPKMVYLSLDKWHDFSTNHSPDQ